MARTDMFMSYLHCFIIRNVTLAYWTPVCQCDGFVFACGTGAGFEAARGATGGCWVVTMTTLITNEYNSSMSSTHKRCRFGGVFVTGGTGGFLLWKSPVRPAARVLRRDDCNFFPVNNFWAFDEITHTDNWTVIPLYCDIAEYFCLYFSLVFYDVKYFYYKYYI